MTRFFSIGVVAAAALLIAACDPAPPTTGGPGRITPLPPGTTPPGTTPPTAGPQGPFGTTAGYTVPNVANLLDCEDRKYSLHGYYGKHPGVLLISLSGG